MADAGCFNDSPNGTDIDTVILPGVNAGDYLGVTSVAGHIGAILEAGEANLSTRPLPAVDSPDDNKYFMLPANGLAVNAASEHPELAMKLIEALSSVEFLNAYAEQSGFMPVVPNDQFQMGAPLETAWSFIEQGRTAAGPWIPGGDAQNAIINGVQELFLGSVSVEEMLANVQDAYAASQ
jgi:raffinose/stachyose/melibiose transport system substrate-binding protein